MRRRRLRSAIRRLNDYGVAVDTADISCAERRADGCLFDPAAIGKTAVALESKIGSLESFCKMCADRSEQIASNPHPPDGAFIHANRL